MILDTNAVSALADGDPAALERLAEASQVVIPVVALGEYRYGIAQSRYRERREDWLARLLKVVRTLEIDAETTLRYAEIRVELKKAGKPIPANDVWIAALCRQHARPVMSRDSHFDAVRGLRRVDW